MNFGGTQAREIKQEAREDEKTRTYQTHKQMIFLEFSLRVRCGVNFEI
jgi:hypothetical protein